MSGNTATFKTVSVRRQSTETDFEVILSPRRAAGEPLDLPNRILSHFLDHFAKASGIAIEVRNTAWPRSWQFDHVLCEDMGQLIGRGVAAIAAEIVSSKGAAGRASATCNMDDAVSAVSITFESRPRCDWRVPRRVDIDGYVDSWYGESGAVAGTCFGTNLRQFVDGFAYGSGASIGIEVTTAGNLHHLYETVFRALGDAMGDSLGTRCTLAGESSGLAGAPQYEVRTDDEIATE